MDIKALLFLAQGFEETEALATVDVLRRGKVEVLTVSLTEETVVEGAHGIVIEADTTIYQTREMNAEILLLPGGMPGSENLYKCEKLQEMLRGQKSNGRKIGAICAAPGLVLGQMGLIEGMRATAYPGFEKYMEGSTYTGEPVTVDDWLITGKGPGYALEFALTVLETLTSKETRDEVARGMLL